MTAGGAFSRNGRRMMSTVIVSAKRTPIGQHMGSLKSFHAPSLGAIAAQGAIQACDGLKAEDIEEVLLGQVLQAGAGQSPARQVCMSVGMGLDTSCTTINRVCASGMKSVTMASQAISAGDRKIMLAGGMESMSNAPHYMSLRSGYAFGGAQAKDAIQADGLTDVYDKILMGACTERVVEELGLSRQAQDDFAVASYEKARAAQEKGIFAGEIVPVVSKDRKGNEIVFDEDEECKKFFPDKFPALRPAFKKEGGSITAANSSKINDGAAALVLMSEDEAKARGLTPKARILGYADAAIEPFRFALAPANACTRLYEKLGLQESDVDYHEINEAFAAVTLGNMQLLDIDPSKVNIHGGAIALGHPIGVSGE